ncbi:MAG: hypothetical protein ABI760_09155 [Ferruginibacter sp.]
MSAADAIDHANAITDYVQAGRVRTEVKAICENWLKENPIPEKPELVREYWKIRYWVQATLGEAYFGLGDEIRAKELLEEAYKNAPEDWMPQSTREQPGKLGKLLEESPLVYVKE